MTLTSAALPDSMSEANTATAKQGMIISKSETMLLDHPLSASTRTDQAGISQHADRLAQLSVNTCTVGAEACVSSQDL